LLQKKEFRELTASGTGGFAKKATQERSWKTSSEDK
jgi:hypothetical protein